MLKIQSFRNFVPLASVLVATLAYSQAGSLLTAILAQVMRQPQGF